MNGYRKTSAIISLFGSIFAAFGVNYIVTLFGQWGIYAGVGVYGYNPMSLLIFAADIVLIYRYIENFRTKHDKRLLKVSLVGGILLSAAIVFGAMLFYTNNLFQSPKAVLKVGATVISWCFITVPLIGLFLDFFGNGTKINFYSEKKRRISNLCYFFISFLAISICYLPTFLWLWPGNFTYDFKYQLCEYLSGYLKTHHPPLHTIMLGKAYDLGVKMGNTGAGLQLYTLFQMLVLASVFAFFLTYLRKKNISFGIRLVITLFFGLYPANQIMAISATKDVFCAAGFLIALICVDCISDSSNRKTLNIVGFVASATISCLFRNNMFFAVTAGLLIITVCTKGVRNKLCWFLLACIFVATFKISDRIVVRVNNAVTEDSYRESLSAPLQQLARVATYRKDTLDASLYDEIMQYVDVEANIYNPYIADSVKNWANEALLKDNIFNFLKLWGKVFIRYPGECAEAFLMNNLGYYYPLNMGYCGEMPMQIGNQQIPGGVEINYDSKIGPLTEPYAGFYLRLSEVPVLGYTLRSAFFVWIIILITLFCVYKKKKEAFNILLFMLMYLATCFLGPVVFFRYIYCLVISLPLLISKLWEKKAER